MKTPISTVCRRQKQSFCILLFIFKNLLKFIWFLKKKNAIHESSDNLLLFFPPHWFQAKDAMVQIQNIISLLHLEWSSTFKPELHHNLPSSSFHIKSGLQRLFTPLPGPKHQFITCSKQATRNQIQMNHPQSPCPSLTTSTLSRKGEKAPSK